MIRFRCPRCETPMEVDESMAGRPARCATCGSTLKIPRTSEATPQAAPKTPPRPGATSVKVHGESVEITPPLEPMAVASAALVGAAVVLLLVFGVALGRWFYPSGWMIGFIIGAIMAFLGAVFGLSAHYNIRRSRGRKGGKLWARIGMLGGLGLGVILGAGAVVCVASVVMRPSCEDNLKILNAALRNYADKHEGHLPKDLQVLVTEGYIASSATLTCPAYRVPTGTQTYRLVPAIPMNDPLFPDDMMIVADGDPVGTHGDGHVRVLLKDGTTKTTSAATWPAYLKQQQLKWDKAVKEKRGRSGTTETPAPTPEKAPAETEKPAPEKEKPPAEKDKPAPAEPAKTEGNPK